MFYNSNNKKRFPLTLALFLGITLVLTATIIGINPFPAFAASKTDLARLLRDCAHCCQ